MRYIIAVLLLLSQISVMAQEKTNTKNDSIPKTGSYLYWGQPSIEDNSMFIEEAFNQEAGIIQHISNFVFDNGSYYYSYTQEIPLADDRHQLSFTIPYANMAKPSEFINQGNNQFVTSGLGDIFINYRPMLLSKQDWALVIPRFTLIIPTGNSQYGLGAGAWGGQFNMAVTKRLSPKVTSHWNAGLTHFTKADYYTYDTEGKPSLLYQKNLGMKNLGASFIWMVKPKFNLMLELVKNYEQEISETGSVDKKQGAIINPGFRFAVDIGKVQIVPGLGVPFNFENGRYTNTGAFIYLSIEPAY